MKLIILNEEQGAGKSSTIREIRNLLIKNNGKIIWEEPKGLPSYINPIKRKKDIISIIQYNNKFVGLCSKGDTPSLIQKVFYNLFYHVAKNKIELDVLICASRNYDSNACSNLKAIINYIDYNLIRGVGITKKRRKSNAILIYSLKNFEIYKKGKNKFDVLVDAKKIFNNI